MSRRTNKGKRAQREKRLLEQQISDYNERPDHRDGPSGGQFYVLNMETGDKTPGLNLREAQALWRSLPRAYILEMDSYTPGRAPLKAVFDAGQIP